jgi:hypothetical protein
MSHAAKGILVSIAVTLALCFLVFAVSGCGYAKHRDPVLYFESSPAAQILAAQLRAKEVGGTFAGPNTCCGSMSPLIVAGDYLVIKPSPFTDALLGSVVIYTPAWNHGQPVAHRLVSGNAKDGFIASGDNNSRSEPSELVTASTYRGEVIAIYRLAP